MYLYPYICRHSIGPCLLLLLLLCGSTSLAQFSQTQEDSLRKVIRELSGHERFILEVEFMNSVSSNDPHDNDEIMEDIRSWAKQHGDTLARLQAKLSYAQHLSRLGNMGTALQLANEVYGKSSGYEELQFRAALFLRNTYYRLGAYDQAISLHARINWDAAPESWEKYAPDNFLSFTYLQLGEYSKAIDIMRECIVAMRAHQQPYWEMSFTNSLGVMYEEAGMLDSAWANYNRALALLDKNFVRGEDFDPVKHSFIEGLFNGNKAQILAKRDNHLQAIPLYKRDIEASLAEPANEEYRRNAITSMIKLSESYTATGQFSKARENLWQARQLLTQSQFPELWISYWKALWSCFDQQDMYDSASVAVKMYIAAQEALDKTNTVKRSQDLQLAYESNLKEQALQERQLEVRNLKLLADEQRLYRNVILVAGVLLMLVVLVLYIAYRQRTESEEMFASKNRQIEEQSQIITNSLREKELLLREIHHRVKNNLQIVSSLLFLQSKKLTDKGAIEVMKEGQSRVQVMSLIHQKLYQQSKHLDEINFQTYFSDLARQIIHSAKTPGTQVQVDVETNNTRMSVDKAIPLGLIINELITNSLKHAFTDRDKGFIKIVIRQENDLIHLHYADNGAGAPDVDGMEKSDSLGMKLIRLLTSQLDGNLSISAKRGMMVDLTFHSPVTGK